MKKIYIGALAAAAAVSMNAGSVMAADPTIAVNLGTENITYSYTLSDEVYENSVKELFTVLDDAAVDETVESELDITSESAESVEIGLRLAVDEADENSEYSVLDYYTFKITDPDGNVVYDSAEEDLTEAGALEKDIPLGTYNTGLAEDTRTYKLEIGVNEAVAETVSAEEAGEIDILVTAVGEPAAAATEAPAAATLKPKFELAASATEAPNSTQTPAVTEAPDATPAPTEAAGETKERKIICGEDIEPGRYTVTGNANVKITTADGELISETTVTDGTDPDIKGVPQFITTLEKGNVITITPISDDIKAAVNFERTNSGSSTRSAAAAASTSNSTAAPKSSSKTNPKTGDPSSTTLLLGSAMGVSAAAAGSLEILKRKKNKDK